MAALIIAKRIGIMPAEEIEHLPSIPQMDFGDAARPRFPVGDHALPIGMQVVMGVGPARRRVIRFGIAFTVRAAPAAKALGGIVQ